MEHNPTGFAWYKEEQYEDLLITFSEDRTNLPDSYGLWLKEAEMEFQRLRDSGVPVYKVEVDLYDFLSWCRANGYDIKHNTRHLFVAHKLRSLLEHLE